MKVKSMKAKALHLEFPCARHNHANVRGDQQCSCAGICTDYTQHVHQDRRKTFRKDKAHTGVSGPTHSFRIPEMSDVLL